MAEAAGASFPEECCGLLLGTVRGGRVRAMRVVHAANVAPERARRRRFEIDPAVLIAVQKALRSDPGPERIIGYFHSHPFGPLRPSAIDLAGASEVGLIAVIAAPVRRTGRVAFGVWLRLGEGNARRFRPLALARMG